jgi:hypothetical protein
MLENQTITNREAVVAELESLQSQISSVPAPLGYKVGEAYEGYIIGAIYEFGGETNLLIISPDNASDGIVWSNVIGESSALSTWNGQDNTDKITKVVGFTTGAAKSALNYTGGGFEDWYLPALDEWKLIDDNILVVNRALESKSMAIIETGYNLYWSSTENFGESSQAWCYGSVGVYGYQISAITKSANYGKVRPIRKVVV